MTLILPAVAAMLCEDVSLVAQVQQRPEVMVSTQDDAATLTTVTAVRPPVGVVLHVLQVHRSLATLSRAAQNLHIVYEITLHYKLSMTLQMSAKIRSSSPSPLMW